MRRLFLALLLLLLCCIIGLANSSGDGASIGYNIGEAKSQVSFANILELADENPIAEGNLSSQMLVISEDNATIYLMQMAPGASVDLHYHAAHDEIAYIISGAVITTVYTEGPEEIHLGPGNMLYLPSGVRHEVRAVGNETVRSISIFVPHFDGRDRIFVSPTNMNAALESTPELP